MSSSDRDHIQDEHPANCTCSECCRKRAGSGNISLYYCPACNKKSVWFNDKNRVFECLNPACQVEGKTLEVMQNKAVGTHISGSSRTKSVLGNLPEPEIKEYSTKSSTGHVSRSPSQNMPAWALALLVVIACYFAGFSLGFVLGTNIPFWLLMEFAVIFSIEKWYLYIIRKNIYIIRTYKFLLNVSFLSALGLIIWSVVKLFTHSFISNALLGSLLVIAEITFLVWIFRICQKYAHEFPSIKVTLFAGLILFVIFAFAGVPPFEEIKDAAFNGIDSLFSATQIYPDKMNIDLIKFTTPDS